MPVRGTWQEGAEMEPPKQNLNKPSGVVQHLLSCIDLCNEESYRESLFHWKFEMQRPQVVNALVSQPKVLEECVRKLQGSHRFTSIVELAKALLLINYSSKERANKKLPPADSGQDVIISMTARPSPLTIFVRLTASGYKDILLDEAMKDGGAVGKRAVWGGEGQSLTMVCLIEFLLHRLRMHVTGDGKVESHVYSNILSLLLDVWDIIGVPGLLAECFVPSCHRLEDCRHIVMLADGLLTAWYERTWKTSSSRKGITDRLQAMGIVGMIVYRLQTQHPSLANCAVFTNLASKHAALEKNMIMKLKRQDVDSRIGHTPSTSGTPPKSSRSGRKGNGNKESFLPSVSKSVGGNRGFKREVVHEDQKTGRNLALVPQLGVACAVHRQESDSGGDMTRPDNRKVQSWKEGNPWKMSKEPSSDGDCSAESPGLMGNAPFRKVDRKLKTSHVAGKEMQPSPKSRNQKPCTANEETDPKSHARMRASTGSSHFTVYQGPFPSRSEEKGVSRYQAERASKQRLHRKDSTRLNLTPIASASASWAENFEIWRCPDSLEIAASAPALAPLAESAHQSSSGEGGGDAKKPSAEDEDGGLPRHASESSLSAPSPRRANEAPTASSMAAPIKQNSFTNGNRLLFGQPKVAHEPDTSLHIDGSSGPQAVAHWFQPSQIAAAQAAAMSLSSPPPSIRKYQPTEHLMNYSAAETAPALKKRGVPHRSDSSMLPKSTARAAALPEPSSSTHLGAPISVSAVWEDPDITGWDTTDDILTPAPVMRKSINDTFL